jgi:hypothetical protein
VEGRGVARTCRDRLLRVKKRGQHANVDAQSDQRNSAIYVANDGPKPGESKEVILNGREKMESLGEGEDEGMGERL